MENGKNSPITRNENENGSETRMIPVQNRGKGKGRTIRRKTAPAMDDILISQAWREMGQTSSPEAKATKRTHSADPERDRHGNMYYKIDPDMMTDFMKNVTTTQRDIQQTMQQQQLDMETEREKRK